MMRTQLALVAMALSATYATAEPDPAPADPYAEPSTPTTSPPPPEARPIATERQVEGPLGITAFDISPDLRRHLGAPRDRGVLVDAVAPASFAAKAGLKVGDHVLDIDNAPVTGSNVLAAAANRHKKGAQIVLDIMRTGIPATLRATLDRDPARVEVDAAATERQLRQQLDDMRRRLDAIERRVESQGKPADGT